MNFQLLADVYEEERKSLPWLPPAVVVRTGTVDRSGSVQNTFEGSKSRVEFSVHTGHCSAPSKSVGGFTSICSLLPAERLNCPPGTSDSYCWY